MPRPLLGAAALALFAALGLRPLAAQEPAPPPTGPSPAATTEPAESAWTNTDVPWRTSYFPYLTGLANDGPLVAARVRYFQLAPYEDRVTARAALQLDAGIGFRGSRFAAAQFIAPRLVRDWRFYALLTAVRESRFGFYGIGEHSVRDPANEENGHDQFYRTVRRSYRAQVDVTRKLLGPLSFGLMGELLSSRYAAPADQTSLFQSEVGPDLRQRDASARAALIYDTRDVEYNTHRGLLLEFGGQLGTGGDGYQRLYGVLRGWVQPREGTVLAARLTGAQLFGTPTLDARYIIPAWERPILVYGGEYSNRGLDLPRYVGKGVLFGNFEWRQEVKSFGDLGAVGFIAFLDAGRVFEPSEFRLTFDDLKVGGGGGLAIRILRGTIFTFTLARGPERTIFTITNGWLF
ncbi:MAG TPA: hypothetical protein VFK09_02500 [Gemmatimonadales bacterium]|jgi:hypothetical protein|nr:hypothetical protein [Gemmatimonadales bacterium]